MFNNRYFLILFSVALLLLPGGAGVADSGEPDAFRTLQAIIGEIAVLESDKDPKCYATATRLENFIYGTPLTSEARVKKIELQKKLIVGIWRQASVLARQEKSKTVLLRQVNPILSSILSVSVRRADKVLVTLHNGSQVELSKRDIEHYSSIAYSYRAMLAVEQDLLLTAKDRSIKFDSASMKAVREFLDLHILVVLQLADQKARETDQREITRELLEEAWSEVLPDEYSDSDASQPQVADTKSAVMAQPRMELINSIIKQKIGSYKAYNRVAEQVFLRNLQVYFARLPWPSNTEHSERIKAQFTENLIFFVVDCLVAAQQLAQQAGKRTIGLEEAHKAVQSFVPFEVNEYEDITFFPNFAKNQQITLESYDIDAFRDSGLHWKYLKFALSELGDKLKLELDPFAAEMVVEGAAQFGVLVLRVAGKLGKKAGAKQLQVPHIEAAYKHLQGLINSHAKLPKAPRQQSKITSSTIKSDISTDSRPFSDNTAASGVQFVHRSSDWLSRMLRSYLPTGTGEGTLAIPPAFGGAGVAAEDLNRDGRSDLLILSGSGNALYVGKADGKFEDVTKKVDIQNRRADGSFAEPRQPLIADFDNDGLPDIFISYANDDHRIYRNLGGLQFKDLSAQAGLGGKGLVGGPATVFDFDGDGLLDLYIGYFGDYPNGVLPSLSRRNFNGQANKLFRNLGSFRFKDVSKGSGTENTGWTQALSHTDFDLDGRQDIIVGNDFGINAYLRNLGQGIFKDVAADLGTDKPSFTMNVGFSDLNGDRHPDIYISNIVTMVKDDKYVLPSKDTPMKFDPKTMARMRVIEANDLFISKTKQGKLDRYLLSNQLVERGFSSTGWAWDADFFDFDNDGDEDLYCVNGMNEYAVYSDTPYYTSVFGTKQTITLPVHMKEKNVFFLNQDAKLRNISAQSGLDLLENSRSAVYLDYDADGDLDIVLNNYHAPAVVYTNHSQLLKNNWIKIKLVGDPAKRTNRDAIGAKLYLSTDQGISQWHEVRGSTGYLSVHPKEQHFGLGKQGNADLTVIWPNGERNEYRNLKANQRFLISQTGGVSVRNFK